MSRPRGLRTSRHPQMPGGHRDGSEEPSRTGPHAHPAHETLIPPHPSVNLMNLTSKLSIGVLVFGLLFFVLSIALLGTSPADIGMLATTLVFVLFGVFGFLLGKQQPDA